MRRKMAVVVGLVAVVLAVTVVVGDRMPPAEPPLRKGMVFSDTGPLMIRHYHWTRYQSKQYLREWESDEPDWLGNRQKVTIYFDSSSTNAHSVVTCWELESLPRTRPPWLDRPLKAIGWD